MLARIWKDPVWASVIATGITAAFGSYWAGWWPAILQAGKDAWTFLMSASAISNWLIGLMTLIALPTIVVTAAVVWQSIRPAGTTRSDWLNYTEDTFFGLRWRWSYSSIGEIQRLTTFCPHCDFQVFPDEASAYAAVDRIRYRCDSCHVSLGEFPESYRSLESKTERFIQQKIRNAVQRGIST